MFNKFIKNFKKSFISEKSTLLHFVEYNDLEITVINVIIIQMKILFY